MTGAFDAAVARLRARGEVLPDQASPGLSAVYADIQAGLGVPFVNFVFRAIATDEPALVETWRASAPAVRSAAFARATDEIRDAVRASVRGTLPGSAPGPAFEDFEGGPALRRFTDTILHVLPQLLVVTTAWAAGRSRAAEGLAPRPRATFPGATALPMLAPEAAPPGVQACFQSILAARGHPGVASYYRALGHHPDFLTAAWTYVAAGLAAPEVARAQGEATARARAAVETLFVPSEVPTSVTELLPVFRERLIPDLLVDVARIRAHFGGER